MQISNSMKEQNVSESKKDEDGLEKTRPLCDEVLVKGLLYKGVVRKISSQTFVTFLIQFSSR